MSKFIELLTTQHAKTLKHLGMFVENAFQCRKDIILL